MESPKDAATDTLRHIAAALSDVGFGVASGLKLIRKRGDCTDAITTTLDRGNRAGEVVRMRFGVTIHSTAVRRWVRAQTAPDLCAEGPWAGIVNTMPLHFAEVMTGRDFDVVNPDDRPFVAESVAAMVRDVALGWFDEMGDPLTALRMLDRPIDLGGPVNPKWIYRLALAHGHDAEARDALAAHCVRHPAFGQALAQYAALIALHGPPAAYRDATEELAAFAVAAGIAP